MFNAEIWPSGPFEKLNSVIGKRVTLMYEQHKGVPTKLFGETEYFVVGASASE